MFQQDLAPLGSLTLSALVALLPLATIFVLLGWLRVKAHWAGLASVAVAIVVAVTAFRMPVGLALLSATEGAVFGLFPIMWIVFTAIWLYQITVVSGRFEDLRAAFNKLSDDPRVQAIIIAFCFGGLLEALAGFGAPVAITGVMLMALGFSPIRAAVVVLLANTAPVAFGAIGTPIITAGTLTGIPYQEIGAYVGRQTPLLALFVPLLLVILVDGKRGARQTWPIALAVGATFAVAQFFASNFLSVELTDIVAALAGLVAAVIMLRFWTPEGGHEAAERLRADREEFTDGPDLTTTGGAGSGAAPTRTVEQAPAVAETAPDPRPAGHGVLPVPADHRRVLAREAVGPGQERPRRDRHQDPLARTGRQRPQRGRQARHLDRLQLPDPLLARHPAAHLRVHHRAGLPRPADPGLP